MIQIAVERNSLTRDEAAQVLGISIVTLTRAAQQGKIGHVLIGGRVRFHREDLERYERGEAPRPEARIGWKPNPKRIAAAKAAAERRAAER